MVETVAPRRFRLLPPNEYIGWTPYAWLIYLPIFFITPILKLQAGTASSLYLAATGAGVVVFLVTYFRGYWVWGRDIYPIIGILAGLGIVFAPVNEGSSVFFVYAATFAAHLVYPRHAERTIAGVTVLGTATAWAVHAPFFYWVTTTVIAPLISGVSLHFIRVGRTHQKLRLANDEIQHLATVAERERIGRDLHDVLGHTLSLIVLKAELASKLADSDPKRAAKEIRDVEQVSRKALQEVREAIRGYRPTLDDEVARAKSILDVASIASAISIGPTDLDTPHEEVLALALREAVTNMVRHSKATTCSIDGRSAGEVYDLVVEDNGRASQAPEGSGLRAMRERVEALGGTVTREAAAGARGTRLRVSI
jgi:two-component system sensor histidine kinase DesK